MEPTRKRKRCWELTIRGCHSCCLVFSADNVTLDHTSQKNAPSLSESWLAVATERHTCERRDPLEARLGIMGSYWNDLRVTTTTDNTTTGWLGNVLPKRTTAAGCCSRIICETGIYSTHSFHLTFNTRIPSTQ